MEKNVYTNENLTNFPSEEYFHINSCGMQNNHKNHFTILRREGRVDFHILYIIKGSLTVVYAGREETLLPGNFVLYPPGMLQRYTFPGEVETVTFWVHFTGRTVPEILDGLHLKGGVYAKRFYIEETRLRGIAEKAKQGALRPTVRFCIFCTSWRSKTGNSLLQGGSIYCFRPCGAWKRCKNALWRSVPPFAR